MGCENDVEVLNPLITSTTCLNQNNQFPVENILRKSDIPLKSDTDHQLVIVVQFSQQVRLSGFKMTGVTEATAPSEVRLFVNKPDMGFSDCEDAEATQDLLLTAKENNLAGGEDVCVNLKYVKFQNVNSLTIFVNENMGGEDFTEIKHMEFYGAKGETTNISDWKPCKS